MTLSETIKGIEQLGNSGSSRLSTTAIDENNRLSDVVVGSGGECQETVLCSPGKIVRLERSENAV